MALSILNNISSLMAQNQLSITGSGLQKTLQRLSSGSKINSGADDAAGLAIANGMSANIAALTQSAQNATASTGKLQTADGALSQVTALLNRAVTLATEASNGTIAAGQSAALDTEFQSILSEINSIGSNTTFNGSAIFQGGSTNYNQISMGNATAAGTATAVSASGDLSFSNAGGNTIYTVTSGLTTVGAVINDINNAGKGLVASLDSSGNLVVTDTQNRSVSTTGADRLYAAPGQFEIGNGSAVNNNTILVPKGDGTVSSGGAGANALQIKVGGAVVFTAAAADATLSALVSDINSSNSGLIASLDGSGNLSVYDGQGRGGAGALQVVYNGTAQIGSATLYAHPGVTEASTTNASTFNTYLSDSTTTGSSSISVTLTALTASGLGLTGNLLNQSAAQATLSAVNVAVSQISALRGNLGAAMNRLTAATNVMNNQVQNLSNAQDGITAADIGQEVANMTKFNVLQQTGIAALQQANQAQQSVLKLLQ